MRKGKSHFKVRWMFGLLSFWALCYNYAAKVILPATLEAMVIPEGENFGEAVQDFDDININRTLSISHPPSQKVHHYEPELYTWDLKIQNVLKEAFFYGYIWTGIIGGRLAERLSVRHTVGTAVLISSLAALIFPYLTKFGVTVTFVVRFIQGMCNGMIYPGLNCIFPRYIPINERSIWGSIIYSGSSLGTLIMLNLSGVLCESPQVGGWRSAYYLLGGTGLLWYISWLICITEKPHKNPFMTEKEYNEISAGTALDRSKKKHSIPWLEIATSPPFYAIGLSAFVYNWAYLTMLTQLPKYLHRVLDFSIEQADEVASLPYVAQSLFGYTAGFILDRMRRGGEYSITFLRKTFNTIGFLGAALCLFSLCFAGTNKWTAVTLLSLTLGFCGVSTVGFKITNVDMSPSFAGTLLGIANTVGNLPGILAPMLVSELVSERHSIGEWNRVFIISACVFIVGALIFFTFASAEVQPWDPISKEINEEKPEKIADVTSIANELRFEEIQLNENDDKNNNCNDNNNNADKK